MSVGVLFEWVSYRAILCLLVAGYLEIKLKKEQVTSSHWVCLPRKHTSLRLYTNFGKSIPTTAYQTSLFVSDSIKTLVVFMTVKNSSGNRSRMSPSVQHVLLPVGGEIPSLHGSYGTLPCSVSPHPQKSASRPFSRSVCKFNRRHIKACSHQAFHHSAIQEK